MTLVEVPVYSEFNTPNLALSFIAMLTGYQVRVELVIRYGWILESHARQLDRTET